MPTSIREKETEDCRGEQSGGWTMADKVQNPKDDTHYRVIHSYFLISLYDDCLLFVCLFCCCCVCFLLRLSLAMFVFFFCGCVICILYTHTAGGSGA